MNDIWDIWFSRIEISNKIKLELLQKFKAKEIFFMRRNELQIILKEKYENVIPKILDASYKINLEKYFQYMENRQIKILKFDNKFYPQKLKNIENRPAYIFTRGDYKILDEENIAIVGSRNASESKKKFTRCLSKQIADFNVNVVSGLALGIDKYAHLGALDSQIGKTIAVLGTGLADNDIYPWQNKKIFDRILEKKGVIISEHVIGTKPLKYHFPLRNRIISGLSEKIVVIQASEKSGSLITANFGLEQGKDIYAVPGDVDDENYKGTNMLIKEGAYLLDSIKDLFVY